MQSRILNLGDEAAYFALEQLCFTRPYSRKQVRDELMHADAVLIGSFDANNELVGAVLLRRMHDEWWIFRIMVHPNFRRKQIASRLLSEAKKYLATHYPSTELWLEVNEKNEAALKLYGAHGFKIVGRRKGYYPSEQTDGVFEDAIMMRCEIEHEIRL